MDVLLHLVQGGSAGTGVDIKNSMDLEKLSFLETDYLLLLRIPISQKVILFECQIVRLN